MSVQAQLVHSSVLSVSRFIQNSHEGITTVVLLDAQNTFEANEQLNRFCDKIKASNPSILNPQVVAYCLRYPRSLYSIYNDVLELLDKPHNSPILN